MEKKFDIKDILRIGIVLFIICALIALLLSAVNELTKEKIEENAQARMDESISVIFGDGIQTSLIDKSFNDPVKQVYEVKDANGHLQGYAVYAVPVGFKGDIEIMVGVTVAGNCKSVEIISMSETPGLGTKVGNEDFLSQYHNKYGSLVLGEDIIPVAGATISSKTVNGAVNEAINAVGGIIG